MNYRRINVVGSSGSGKSTLAKKIAQKLSVPYIEMDKLFWLENWTHRSDEEFREIIAEHCSHQSWVLDGNYTHTDDIKWKNVEAVVWIDLPFYKNFYQSLKRTVGRCITKEELWEGTGNHESFKMSFFSKDSVLLWLIKVYSKNKRKYLQAMNSSDYQHVDFYRLQNSREVEYFLESLTKKELD